MDIDEPTIQDIIENPNNLEYVIHYENIPKSVIIQAVRNYPHTLQYVNRYDREIVLTAVRSYGGSLQYAGDDLKNDPEVVQAAIESRAFAIQHASANIRDQSSFMLWTIARDSSTFKFASKRLREDKHFRQQACKLNPDVIHYINNPDDDLIIRVALQKDPFFNQEYQRAFSTPHILSRIVGTQQYTHEDWDRAVQEIESEMVKRARENIYKIDLFFK